VLLDSESAQDIRPIDLELWDLDEVDVRREWQNIDIFLEDQKHQFAVIIENKIKSGESPHQLEDYLKTIKQQYRGYKILPIFLTPDGVAPSVDAYLPVSYQVICETLERILDSRKSTMGSEVITLIQHYTQMLRRHIMSETEIAELCRSIYRKHQRALDLIYEYRTDLQGMIREFLVELVSDPEKFVILRNIKSEVRFIPKQWDRTVLFPEGDKSSSNPLLLFYFHNMADRLRIRLVIAPGLQEFRQKLYEMAIANHPILKSAHKKLYPVWHNIYTRTILVPNDYEDANLDTLKTKIGVEWQKFVDHDLPSINKIVEKEIRTWASPKQDLSFSA
jgi:hypothetical protein